MRIDFRWIGILKIDSFCDCAGEPTHAITTLLSNWFNDGAVVKDEIAREIHDLMKSVEKDSFRRKGVS